MTTPTKNLPAVAERDAGVDAAGRAQLAKIRSDRAFIVAVTNDAWGKAMTPLMRKAFAEYCRRFRLDPSEVDNLGGRPYRNGYYYRRRIAEMRTRNLIEWTEGEHIGPDARLEQLVAAGDDWAKQESVRRTRERIRWAVPEDATHAYVVHVKLRSDEKVLEGCDWITPARMKKVKDWGDDRKFKGWKEVPADPVGAEEPEKTVITRAWRRAGLLVAAEIPELQADENVMDLAADAVEVEVEAIAEDDEGREQQAKIEPKQIVAPANPAGDPYSTTTTREPVPAASPAAAQSASPPSQQHSARREPTEDERRRMTPEQLDAMRFED